MTTNDDSARIEDWRTRFPSATRRWSGEGAAIHAADDDAGHWLIVDESTLLDMVDEEAFSPAAHGVTPVSVSAEAVGGAFGARVERFDHPAVRDAAIDLLRVRSSDAPAFDGHRRRDAPDPTSTDQQRARRALARRLADAGVALDRRGRATSLADTLSVRLSTEQRLAVVRQLGAGDGGELLPGRDPRTGETYPPNAHSAWSSAMLAVNAFARWLGRADRLELGGVGAFDDVRLESRLPIGRGAGVPNLDVLAESATALVGVESKLTEHLAPHRPVAWKAPYEQDEVRRLLGGGWAGVMEASLDGSWQPTHLHVEQLVKHALGLQANRGDRAAHLVYVWWEPTNGDDVEAVRIHRQEVDELRRRVGDAAPRFTALIYDELWRRWAEDDDLVLDVERLRARYDVAI